MEKKHYNELVLLSQEIYDHAADRLTNYCAERYCGIGNDSMEQQLEDYLFTARQTSAFLLGNALALLSPESREEEIQSNLPPTHWFFAFRTKRHATPPSAVLEYPQAERSRT